MNVYFYRTLVKNNYSSRKNNVARLREGIAQVQMRNNSETIWDDNFEGILVTDYEAYMNIYYASQRKHEHKNEKQFIKEMDAYLNEGGRLCFIEGLWENSNKITYELKEAIEKL